MSQLYRAVAALVAAVGFGCHASQVPLPAHALPVGLVPPVASSPLPAAASATQVAAPAAPQPVDCQRFYQLTAGWAGKYWGAEDGADTVLVVAEQDEISPALAARCEHLRANYPSAELTCYRTKSPNPRGFWALLVLPSKTEQDYVRWQLLYTNAAGQTQKGYAWPAGDGGDPAAPANDAPTIAAPIAIADLDGDGEDEIVTAVTQWTDSGDHQASTINAWTIKDGKIVELDVTARRRVIYCQHEGPDRAGALEFVVDPYVTAMAPVGMTFAVPGGWVRNNPLWSMLVALDAKGHPVDDGAASVGYARELCPTPAGLLEGLKSGAEHSVECVAGYVHCANIWGLAAQDVDAALDAYCASPLRAEAGGGCDESLSEWKSMMRVRLPVKLLPGPTNRAQAR